MDKTKFRNDFILIISLLVTAIVALSVVLILRKKNNLVASVYVQNEIVQTIDLSNKTYGNISIWQTRMRFQK